MGLYEMSDAEAQHAFEALERRRIARLCECDDASGYICSRCARIMRAADVGEVVPKETDAVRWTNVEMASFKGAGCLDDRIAANEEFEKEMQSMLKGGE